MSNQQSSKYRDKVAGKRPSHAPWGFPLAQMRKVTVTVPVTEHTLKLKVKSGKFVKQLFQ